MSDFFNDPAVIIGVIGVLVVSMSSLTSVKVLQTKKEKDFNTQVKELSEKIYGFRTSLEDDKPKLKLFDVVNAHVKDESDEQTANKNEKNNSVEEIIDKNKIEMAVQQHFMEVHQKQAIHHSTVQFYTGIIMSILGFAFFIYTILISLNSPNNLGIGIRVVGSLIFEAVSLLFLKESQKLRESAKQYHDNLYESNQHQEAINVASDIEDKEIKSAIQAQLSLHMMGVSSDNLDVTKIIESQKKFELDKTKKATS